MHQAYASGCDQSVKVKLNLVPGFFDLDNWTLLEFWRPCGCRLSKRTWICGRSLWLTDWSCFGSNWTTLHLNGSRAIPKEVIEENFALTNRQQATFNSQRSNRFATRFLHLQQVFGIRSFHQSFFHCEFNKLVIFLLHAIENPADLFHSQVVVRNGERCQGTN